MVEAFITGTMLRWARERSYPSIDAAAEKLNIKAEKLAAWESGETRPTFLKAQELAKKLRIPFGYLYLSTPPDENLPLPDLRTRAGTLPRRPSPDFLEVLYDALRKQEWYHDYLSREQADRVPFVGRFTVDSKVSGVAADIRRVLRLDEPSWHPPRRLDEFLSEVIQRTERAGVLVMHSSVVDGNNRRHLDPDEFQGFAISDDLAPLVFINQNDYLSAQVFTLAHELAHIWMGLSGVSGLGYLEKPAQQPHSYERVTDAVAAETLVPARTFELRWDKAVGIDKNLEDLSSHYRVSRFVILRRAYELDMVESEVFRAKYAELRERTHIVKKGGGGNYHSTVFSRNGKVLTTTLLYSVLEGRISPTEASVLLNVRVAKLRGLEKYLAQRRTTRA